LHIKADFTKRFKSGNKDKMLRVYSIITVILLATNQAIPRSPDDLIQDQKRFSRVRTAFADKELIVKNLFFKAKAQFPPENLYIRIFKLEQMLELWSKSAATDTLVLVKQYKICAMSGDLGPKRKQGDLQVPEGFYRVSGYNPVSTFYLSLRINYPNHSDRILGYKNNLGGDIFIHGDCVTLGCLPITDDKIKELYLSCLLAEGNGQNDIQVHIYPFCLKNKLTTTILKNLPRYEKYWKFWENLQCGYDSFEKKHKLFSVSVDKVNGLYVFQ